MNGPKKKRRREKRKSEKNGKILHPPENSILQKELEKEKARAARSDEMIRDLGQKETMLAETVRERDALRQQLEDRRENADALQKRLSEARGTNTRDQ